MAISSYLAKLIGPIFVVIGLGMLLNSGTYRALVQEFVRSHALIYLSGLLSITGGLALVLSHNVWTADWRVIVTALGWLALIGGAARIVLPQQVAKLALLAYGRPPVLMFGGAAVVLLGLVLCLYGYLR